MSYPKYKMPLFCTCFSGNPL